MRNQCVSLVAFVALAQRVLFAQKINAEGAAWAALVILIAITVFGLFVLGVIGWLIVLAARNPQKAKQALPVFAFCMAAVCGVLWIADSLRIVQFTDGTSDRIWFGLVAVLFAAVGAATHRAFGVKPTDGRTASSGS